MTNHSQSLKSERSPDFLKTKTGEKIAYRSVHLDHKKDKPVIIFLPGFKSDMQGSKATFLEEKCFDSQTAFIRFDYRGHGESEGAFADFTLSDWVDDAQLILNALVPESDCIIIGSSMGGWLALRIAEHNAQRIKALIGIAAAPDFTAEIKAQLNADQKQSLEIRGYFTQDNEYSDDPYIFTKRLLDDGDQHLMLSRQINYNGPSFLLQGMQDSAVAWQKAYNIEKALISDEVDIHLFENGGHSLSEDEQLAVLWSCVQQAMKEKSNNPVATDPEYTQGIKTFFYPSRA